MPDTAPPATFLIPCARNIHFPSPSFPSCNLGTHAFRKLRFNLVRRPTAAISAERSGTSSQVRSQVQLGSEESSCLSQRPHGNRHQYALTPRQSASQPKIPARLPPPLGTPPRAAAWHVASADPGDNRQFHGHDRQRKRGREMKIADQLRQRMSQPSVVINPHTTPPSYGVPRPLNLPSAESASAKPAAYRCSQVGSGDALLPEAALAD